MIQVRRAHAEDIDWLVSQLRQFADFFGSKQSLFGDEAYVRSVLAKMISDHIVLIAEKGEGQRVGMVGGLVTPHPFNPAIRALAETFFWVAAKFRQTFAGGKAASMLIDEFISWGKEHVTWITFTRESKSPLTDRTLTKRGFHCHEHNYLMEVC